MAKYHVPGLIDWEHAFAGPWEAFGDFPLTLSRVLPAMDAPCNYDEEGRPKDADQPQTLADRKDYLTAVRQEEIKGGDNDFFYYRQRSRIQQDNNWQLPCAFKAEKLDGIPNRPMNSLHK